MLVKMVLTIKKPFTTYVGWKYELGFKIFWYRISTKGNLLHRVTEVCNVNYTPDFMKFILTYDNTE